MRTASRSFKACYDQQLERDPDTHGRMQLVFTVTNDSGAGKVRDASIAVSEDDEAAPGMVAPMLELCVLNKLSETTFPPPAEPTKITYPLVFSAARPRSREFVK